MSEDRGSQFVPDWGIGRYESTAERLLPAARVVVERAAIQHGEHVLDLGCGTGNAALLAAACGAHVIGVDPAARLLDVARVEAERQGADITLSTGDASSVPIDDASVDVVMSVFGVIFAPDAGVAAAEMSRVLHPCGRVVLSAWVPQGTLMDFTSAAADAVRHAVGASPPESFAWHDRDALSALFAPHDLTVEVDEHVLSISDSSPSAYLDRELREHPMAVAGMAVLGHVGGAEPLRDRLLQILEDGNEDSTGFRMTSRYVVATARRGGG